MGVPDKEASGFVPAFLANYLPGSSDLFVVLGRRVAIFGGVAVMRCVAWWVGCTGAVGWKA